LDLEQLKQILNLVREHELSEIEIEHEGLRLKIRKNGAGPPVVALPAASVPVALSSTASAAPSPAATSMPSVAVSEASPEPGAASFVEIGSTVKKGQVLCIIEAMKLMNEIDSEYDGEVANIYVENGQPVQYGERLFAIRTR